MRMSRFTKPRLLHLEARSHSRRADRSGNPWGRAILSRRSRCPLADRVRLLETRLPTIRHCRVTTSLSRCKSRNFALSATYPLIGAIGAKLARSPAIRLLDDQLIWKPSAAENAAHTVTGWHADRAYWATCSSDNLITAWIPFHDVPLERAPLAVMAGSHRWSGTQDLRQFNKPRPRRRARGTLQSWSRCASHSAAHETRSTQLPPCLDSTRRSAQHKRSAASIAGRPPAGRRESLSTVSQRRWQRDSHL